MSNSTTRIGLLLIISSPSGAGKSTLSTRLLEHDPDIQFSVSATTRLPRDGEVEAKDYYFKTKDEFTTMANEGGLLEHAEVFDHCYGTPLEPVQSAIYEGKDVLFDVDWQGGQQIKASNLGHLVVSIFILPPSIIELRDRLLKRGKDSDEIIARRMKKSYAEISHWHEYDYVLVNDNLDQCEVNLKDIIQVERMKSTRNPELKVFVETLNKEFKESL